MKYELRQPCPPWDAEDKYIYDTQNFKTLSLEKVVSILNQYDKELTDSITKWTGVDENGDEKTESK